MLRGTVVLCALLCCHSAAATPSVHSLTPHGSMEGNGGDNATTAGPMVYSLHIESDISFRYARTSVSSKMANPANISQAITFNWELPEEAFITGFRMEMDGHVYGRHSEQEYNVSSSYLSFRDSILFTVTVNVQPQKTVTFNLAYEELLTRKLGAYKHVINLVPGLIPQNLSIVVCINESSEITSLVVPDLSAEREVDPSTGTVDPLVRVRRPSPYSAIVELAATLEQQESLDNDGQKHFDVQYTLERTNNPNDFLVNGSSFVHFFVAPELPPLRKHVTFVLDISHSMRGSQMGQLKTAVTSILDGLTEEDFFGVITFSDKAQVWHQAVNETGRNELGASSKAGPARATLENIANAKKFVQKLTARGGSNINEALLKAVETARASSHAERIVVVMTTGKPNIGVKEEHNIVSAVTRANTGAASVFTLALGSNPGVELLKKLSSFNSGVAVRINGESNTDLQIRDFQRQLSDPAISDVSFTYKFEECRIPTKRSFRRLFSGTEMVVAGCVRGDEFDGEVEGHTRHGNVSYPVTPLVFTVEEPRTHNAMDSKTNTFHRIWMYLITKEKHETRYLHNGSKNYGNISTRKLSTITRQNILTPVTSLTMSAARTARTKQSDSLNYDLQGDTILSRS